MSLTDEGKRTLFAGIRRGATWFSADTGGWPTCIVLSAIFVCVVIRLAWH